MFEDPINPINPINEEASEGILDQLNDPAYSEESSNTTIDYDSSANDSDDENESDKIKRITENMVERTSEAMQRTLNMPTVPVSQINEDERS